MKPLANKTSKSKKRNAPRARVSHAGSRRTLLSEVPVRIRFDIIGHRKWFYLLSALVVVIGLAAFLWPSASSEKGYHPRAFNLSTDYVSGTRIEARIGAGFNPTTVRNIFSSAGYTVESITAAGSDRSTAVVQIRQFISQDQELQLTHLLQKSYPHFTGSDLNVTRIDPVIGRETSQRAILGLLIANLLILIYVAIRFEYRFGVAAVIALLHDALIVCAFFAFFHWEVDINFIAAILTVVGYSVTDTVVIFDRVRENMAQHPPANVEQLLQLTNRSLWQTMARSINTVFTVLVCAIALFLLGGEGIHYFALALVIGLLSGAYSSIFIAAPLWFDWRKHQVEATAQGVVRPAGEQGS